MLKSFLVLILTAVTVWLCYAFPNAATDPQAGLLMKLPENIPNHLTYDREVSEEEKVWLPSDTEMLKRTYYPKSATSAEEARKKSISATLILSGSDQRSLHRPEVCLDGQGWTVVKSPIVTLDVNDQPLQVKDLHLERVITMPDNSLKKVQAHYVYWWVGSKDSTADTAERAFISARENIFYNRNTRWGYPSIMTYVDLDKREEREVAQKRAYDFIEQYGSTFLKNY